MKAHKQLNEIVTLIWYEDDTFDFYEWLFVEMWVDWQPNINWWTTIDRIVDVREIIYTPDFMDKYTEYLWDYEKIQDMWMNLMDNLENSVEYLYNLLNLWK